ncbi:hypothetical protein LV161_008852 [Aspergillus fumigatus]|nr:hypothetical protein LV161_008852 [Aspergillus fumigatus]
MGRRGKHASFVDVGGGTHYIVTDNESLLALKNAILEDPVVASNSVARDGDYERFQLYFRQLVLLGEIPLEDTPWERDEVQNMLDRVYLGVEQATLDRLQKIKALPLDEVSEEQLEFWQAFSKVYGDEPGVRSNRVDPREVLVSQSGGRFIFKRPGES